MYSIIFASLLAFFLFLILYPLLYPLKKISKETRKTIIGSFIVKVKKYLEPTPVLTTSISVLLGCLFFACLYFILDKVFDQQFVKHGIEISKISFWEAFYLSMITQSTVGYGDITPIGLPSRLVACIHGFLTIVAVFRVARA